MAKLSKKTLQGLVDSGYMEQADYDRMVADGAISASSRGSGTKLVMETADGVNVVPSFYWGGGGSVKAANYTDEMSELKSKVSALIKEYAHEVKNTVSDSETSSAVEDSDSETSSAAEEPSSLQGADGQSGFQEESLDNL